MLGLCFLTSSTKAFDSIPHCLPFRKLCDSGLWQGIPTQMDNSIQSVVQDGTSCDSTHALSRVPQRLVLGPLLFLAYTNGVCNLPFEPSTKLILFANDNIILMYRPLFNLRRLYSSTKLMILIFSMSGLEINT